MFDESFMECYNEWANDELIWSRGQFNWCRAYSKDEWERKPSQYVKSEVPEDHPLCQFGG